MRIGITYQPAEDVCWSGKNQTALVLAELFSVHLGCRVVLVNTKEDDAVWWENVPRMEGVACMALSSVGKGELDVLVDIDACVRADRRGVVARTSVAFLRGFVQFSELDAAIYPEAPYVPCELEGLHAVWCWDVLNPPETLDALQTLFPCPLHTVPFVWSPRLAEAYRLPVGAGKSGDEKRVWSVHVTESNRDNTSSCILPLVAIRELCLKQIVPSALYFIHDADHIRDNRFFKENILNNMEVTRFPIEFLPRESVLQWTGGDHLLFSHARFLALRVELLLPLWLGIPVIHNSPVLAALHPSLLKTSYVGNQVGGICEAFRYVTEQPLVYAEELEGIRSAMLSRWGMAGHTEAWTEVVKELGAWRQGVQETQEKQEKQETQELHIAFSDMWPGFNYDVNFFIDGLRHELVEQGWTTAVHGAAYSVMRRPDLVICGPYSSDWKQIPAGIPKVFFSAENWPVPSDPSIALYLTPSRAEDDRHLRLPTWMTFVDWFSGSRKLPVGCEDNPIRLPLWFATQSHSIDFADRPDFCGFVVSNPVCAMRNETFHCVNAYKHVDSGGQLYNNIGGALALKYAGGGCGDISKYHFFSSRRFSISFENSQAPGYITEKVLHAKMAGCVPLYWGDAETDTDFVPGSFVNLSHLTDAASVLAVLQKLEERPDLCMKIASTPLLDDGKVKKAHGVMQTIMRRLLELAKGSASLQIPTIPAKIQNVFVINLGTRRDRWTSLMAAEPWLLTAATRIPGVHGPSLQMSPFLYRMFEKNEFQWKKSVMGCNLSHMAAWSRVLQEKEGEYFLILEDDVRFVAGWQEKWAACAAHIPQDADLLYLGGVLPPNKGVLDGVLERVNHHWARVKPNTYFSTVPAPVFHFCAYSYVLTRSGAKKLLDFLASSDRRSFTVSDHLLGSPLVGLVKYVAQPLLTYCFQEEDPVYLQSQFNDLMRKDTFDSDIWNNTACFTEEELAPFRGSASEATPTSEPDMDVYCFQSSKEPVVLYEQAWLEDLFGRSLRMKPLEGWEQLIPDGAWVLVQRPHSIAFRKYFAMLQERGIRFKVLHLSDEFGQDGVDFYTFSCCKAVVRNYWRNDVPSAAHILTIPLGYHHRADSSKPFGERTWMWSFHGTGWFDREAQLAALQGLTPRQCLILPDWNHPGQLGAKEYGAMLAESKFVPILRGNNCETFRFYEALEAGAIPIVISEEKGGAYYQWVRDTFHIGIYTREEARDAMEQLQDSDGVMCQCEQGEQWSRFKQEVREKVRRLNV